MSDTEAPAHPLGNEGHTEEATTPCETPKKTIIDSIKEYDWDAFIHKYICQCYGKSYYPEPSLNSTSS